MIPVESGASTDAGRIRENNEDRFLADDRIHLYAVADGMGGHRGGEVASALVVETLYRCMEGPAGEERLLGSLGDADPTLSAQANRMLAAIRSANRAVFERARTDPSVRGMGSTLAAVCFTPRTMIAANIGDSSIFLAHGDSMDALSVLHTVGAEFASAGQGPSATEPAGFSALLTRGMGVAATVEPHLCEVPCFEGDRVVLCSDGLTDCVAVEEIHECVRNRTPQAACERLVRLANERGGHDNVTVVALAVGATGRGPVAFLRRIRRKARHWWKGA